MSKPLCPCPTLPQPQCQQRHQGKGRDCIDAAVQPAAIKCLWPCASGEYIGKAVDDSVGLQVPNTVNFFDGKMIVTDATLGTTAGRVLSFDVPQSAYLGTLTVRQLSLNTCSISAEGLCSAHPVSEMPAASATEAMQQV